MADVAKQPHGQDGGRRGDRDIDVKAPAPREDFCQEAAKQPCAGACALPMLLQGATRRFEGLPAALAQLERRNGGRLGVSVLDTATAEHAGYRAEERFAMCSTFKFLLAAAVLQRVDRDQEIPNDCSRSLPRRSSPIRH